MASQKDKFWRFCVARAWRPPRGSQSAKCPGRPLGCQRITSETPGGPSSRDPWVAKFESGWGPNQQLCLRRSQAPA
eukprot:3966380-Pyramimonas_sp.AAC.1